MIEQLKERLATEECLLEERAGKMARFSAAGPVSVGLVRAVIRVAEAQARRIDELERELGLAGGPDGEVERASGPAALARA